MTTFKRNLLIGYGLTLLMLIGSSIASYVSIANLLSSAQLVNRTTEIARKVDGVLAILIDAETAQRGYLLTTDDRFLVPFNGSYDAATALVNEVLALTTDDSLQQVNCKKLKAIAQIRINYLKALIDKHRTGEVVGDSLLLIGKGYMDVARLLVKDMQQREQVILDARTKRLNRFADATPVLILVALVLAIFITIVSLFRVLKDHNKKMALQAELQQKDEEISRRLKKIDDIANEVSAGNYKIQIDDQRKDSLGSIAGSLNKMADSLDVSFAKLAQRDWLQTGLSTLNNIVIEEQEINAICQGVLDFVATYTGSLAAALYISDGAGAFELTSGYALPDSWKKRKILSGEGLAGQAARSRATLAATGFSEEHYHLSFVSGEIKPRYIIAVPLVYNKKVKGVVELAGMQEYASHVQVFLEAAMQNTAIAVNTAQARQKVQELLEETQSQSEELQAQHNELENINAELEAQAEKLQASEEELKVQQEELQQANSELEERSSLLEEKNELILERNLQIQKKAEELSLSTKYKSEFLANMSHELRTPLNSILLLSRLLSENHDNSLSKEQIEYATVIQTSGNNLLTLIDEILDLSRIEAGKMEMEFTDVNLAVVLGELESLFIPIAKDKGIQFSANCADDVPKNIKTDRFRLEQILRNLVSNALKFTKKGSVHLRVSVQHSVVNFYVKDSGIGIPKDKQLTIFDAFQQADGSTRRQFGGTGLGLSISRELARLLGGEINLKSEVGRGSEFTLSLPIIKGAEVPAEKSPVSITEPVKDNFLEVSELPVSETNYISEIIPLPVEDDRNNLKQGDKVILIVEDDRAFARSLLDYTRKKGYKGVVAVRGDEGIELAKQILPLGILLDIQLPVKSGWDVMEVLKSDPVTRPIPVHIMSNHDVRTKSLSSGAVDFINKPMAFEKLGEIFTRIEEALIKHPKKVMIVEENEMHAQALAYFLGHYNVSSEIRSSVGECIAALNNDEVDCVILDMGIVGQGSYATLEEVKKTPGLENVPIIIFTGKNLSHAEELKIKQYAETIVVKTAHSYQRILDEVSLFLHLVEEGSKEQRTGRYKRMGELGEVLKGKTVLVADDDVRNIFSITKSLEKYGMNVFSAVDGKDALQQLEANSEIDLVLMDMMMPEMDGYEATKLIRQNPKYKKLPVIAVTAKAMSGDREKCIAAGASDYVTKPVDVDQLVSLLRVWLYYNLN